MLVGLAKLAASHMESVDDDNVLAYAFMFNRHGARVPLLDFDPTVVELFAEDIAKFPVEVEMLTPSGMRQMYLKGRYNKERYESLLSS